jgi:negative regulator of flagellin synthesis FlgM
MLIDPKIQFPSDARAEQASRTKKAANAARGASRSSGPAASRREDRMSLSSKHGEVRTLEAGLANVPEVRAERVSALKRQVSSGEYQPSSEKVAEAIVREYSGNCV